MATEASFSCFFLFQECHHDGISISWRALERRKQENNEALLSHLREVSLDRSFRWEKKRKEQSVHADKRLSARQLSADCSYFSFFSSSKGERSRNPTSELLIEEKKENEHVFLKKTVFFYSFLQRSVPGSWIQEAFNWDLLMAFISFIYLIGHQITRSQFVLKDGRLPMSGFQSPKKQII